MPSPLPSLRARAAELPLLPGVYLMKDAGGAIIYVGKSKALRNRVSSYFEEGAEHTPKTARMVSLVRSFDYILCDTEIEALALENKLIKLHRPKYNIKLRDDKSYPYIRLFPGSADEWPTLTVTRRRNSDGARYFGPYQGMAHAYGIVGSLRRALGLPSCKRRFPGDIGKARPCLYAQIGECAAPCTGELSREQYEELFGEAEAILRGASRGVRDALWREMEEASARQQYEAAAAARDRLRALERLLDKQKTVGSPDAFYDAAVLFEGETCACLAIALVREGVLADTSFTILSSDLLADAAEREEAVLSALYELYRAREDMPRELDLDVELSEDNRATLERSLSAMGRGEVRLRRPYRGDKKETCRLLLENAEQKTREHEASLLRESRTLARLAALLGLEVLPERIEAVDISNLGDEMITAGLVLFVHGAPDKSGYRTYKIRGVSGQDDYAAMREAISRRLDHADTQPLPDLLLLDGGVGHVHTIRALLAERGVELPIFGMVKDEYHKTRTLTDGEGEIAIAGETAVFTLIYKIQEEVHRYTVGRMMRGKRKSLTTSVLTKIPGIGEKKATALLRALGGSAGVREADEATLAAIPGITKKDATAIRRAVEEGLLGE